MRTNRLAAVFLLVTLLLSLAAYPAAAQETDQPNTTHIFFSAGCADCWPYTEDVLLPTLQARGLAVSPEIHDYTAPNDRSLLLDVTDSIELPRSIADSLYAIVPTEQVRWSFSAMCHRI